MLQLSYELFDRKLKDNLFSFCYHLSTDSVRALDSPNVDRSKLEFFNVHALLQRGQSPVWNITGSFGEMK
jgi:hypothetical protein